MNVLPSSVVVPGRRADVRDSTSAAPPQPDSRTAVAIAAAAPLVVDRMTRRYSTASEKAATAVFAAWQTGTATSSAVLAAR